MGSERTQTDRTNAFGRRGFLGWAGATAIAVAGNGFVASRATAAPAQTAGTSPAVQWTFEPASGAYTQPLTTSGTAVSWDFDTAGDAQGWQPTNGLSDFTVADGTLTTTVTGSDPYMIGPPVSLLGARDRLLRLRAKLSAGSAFKVYFATKEEPDLAEAMAISIPAQADGEFHDYSVDMGQNAHWRNGTVTTVRLDREPADDDGAEVVIDQIRIDALAPRLAVTPLAVSPGSVRPGEQAQVSTTIANVGGEQSAAFMASLDLPTGLELVEGSKSQSVPALDLGAQHRLAWTVRATGTAPVVVALECQATDSTVRFGAIVPIVPGVQPLPTPPTAQARCFVDRDGNAYLFNRHLQAVLVRSPEGFSQLQLRVRAGQGWQSVATAQPMSWLLASTTGGPQLLPLVPDRVGLQQHNGAGLVASGGVTDADGVHWQVRLSFSLADDAKQVQANYQVTPDRTAHLAAFRGPTLTVGERSTGTAKKAALFPGLEWLVDDEVSSSTLDADPPINLRTTPHPLKLTMPLMAVCTDAALVAVLWDNQQRWDGQHSAPSTRFASPNWLDGQDNHLLSLFAPSVPDFVEENAPEAQPAYSAAAHQPIAVSAHLVADQGADLLQAPDHWQDLYGQPDPASKPFSWATEIDLVRHAYADSYWDDDVKGWPHVYGWEPERFPLLAVNLRMAALLSPPGAARDAALAKVATFVDTALAKDGPDALAHFGGAHINTYAAPFHLGHVLDSLAYWRGQIAQTRSTQLDNGAWPFVPSPDDPMHDRLGKRGAPIMGLTATNAHMLLRYARLTGDADARAAGLRAIAFLDGTDVPRAAQSWEVPIHTPDVLASGYGVGAYAEAYRLTGQQRYLERAVYWARTGLPFLYAWSAPDRPLTPYASIPVFGASVFTNSWFGVPVQWNGLVYAFYLLDLIDAAINRDGTGGFTVDAAAAGELARWRTVAEGVVVSALYQQRTVEPAKGGYPDNWPLIPNEPVHNVDINPDAIFKPAIMLLGHQADLRSAVVRRADQQIRVNTVAQIDSATSDASGLSLQLRYFDGVTTNLTVGGGGKPSRVRVNGQPLPAVDDVDAAEQGWIYADDALVLKLIHTASTTVDIAF